MKKASLFLSTIGATAFTCGGAGLDGPTPVGCVIVILAGIVMFLTGVVLNKLDKQNKRARAEAESKEQQRKDEFIKVWETCHLAE